VNIYVGNLSPRTSESHIREAFARFGKVGKISMAAETSVTNSFGYCFVEMPFAYQATVAIRELNGKLLGENPLNISESELSA
jgi:RNA recognition motif-containing protein